MLTFVPKVSKSVPPKSLPQSSINSLSLLVHQLIINNLLNVADKQDVTTMYNLMQLIWLLSPPMPMDNPINCQGHIALNQHSKLLQGLILLYINNELSLHDPLKYLSAAAHVAYIFFTHNNACSSYIPTTLYHNTVYRS